MKRNAARAVLMSAAVLLFAAWSALLPDAGAAIRQPPRTVRLRVMNINIFYGGDELNLTSGNWCSHPDACSEAFDQVVETIRAAGPDIVLLEEAERNTRPIAERLGWHYSERLQIASRFPLIDPPGGDGIYIFVVLGTGRVAALANVHLPSDPYGPYIIQEGATPDDVRALEESVRLPAIRDQLRLLPPLAARGIPVFLAGDFNSPSHLDWTPAVDAVREEVRFPFVWPVSAALAGAGFRDSYRVVHPDPVARPGFTWTPGGPESITAEVHDRIDWVLYAGPARPIASQIVGEAGGPDVDIALDPYPTDHRGVVTTFDVTPADAPILVAVEDRRLQRGDDLGVLFHSAGRRGERIAIVAAGGAGTDALAARPTGGGADGRVVFATHVLSPGAYEAVLLDSTSRVVSRSPFWLYAPGTPTTVATSKSVYFSGEEIDVAWANAPGMRWDWLAIYKPGATDDSPHAVGCDTYNCAGNKRYLIYEYTRTAIEGTARFTAASAPGWLAWPMQPGNYEIRLLVDDGYRSVAGSEPFKIVAP